MFEKYNAHVEVKHGEPKEVESASEAGPVERFNTLLAEKMEEIKRLRLSHVEHPTQGFDEDAEALSDELHHELDVLLGGTPDVDKSQNKLVPE